MSNDLLLLKIGKFYDWKEIDVSIPENQAYMDETIETFLDLTVSSKNNPLGRKKLSCTDKRGNRHQTTVKDLVGGGLRVYYHDNDAWPNLTPLASDRAEGMLEDLLEEIELISYQEQQRSAA